MKLLLTVEDHFLLKNRGLVVVPHLDIPDGVPFKDLFFSDQVLVQSPDGTETQLSIAFGTEHFNRPNPDLPSFVLTVTLPEGTKETVPIGSKLFVSEEVFMKLAGEGPDET